MIAARTLKRYAEQSRPFTIHLADGRLLELPHGDFVQYNLKSEYFTVHTEDGVEIFSLMMVVSIHQSKRKARKGGM